MTSALILATTTPEDLWMRCDQITQLIYERVNTALPLRICPQLGGLRRAIQPLLRHPRTLLRARLSDSALPGGSRIKPEADWRLSRALGAS